MSGEGKLEIASLDRSTTAASEAPSNRAKRVAFDSSPAASEQELAPAITHEELQVRNTFIHFESESVDERVVQSMPHGMFKQCLLAESQQGSMDWDIPTTAYGKGAMDWDIPTTDYDTPGTPTTASEPDLDSMACLVHEPQAGQRLPLSLGTLVVVEGLVKVPAFNGRSAVVQGWDEESGRYNILIASPSGCQQAKIKEENLRMVLPCPR